MTLSATIGLEIHAELKTKTKMFCNSKNDPFAAEANVHVCPVCLAHPGTLPIINREAVHHVLRVGAALGGSLADYTEFDRKNYFYPDLPKGYQLSQFEFPLVQGGMLADVQLTRIHLEEDTASSAHSEEGGSTVIDYNRAGVPLMELVTEPVIKNSKQAGMFARELQLLLRYMNASAANMEKGEMRVEANISVSADGSLGTKVEVKNLNSFRAMERAIDYEIRRQSALIEKGDVVEQETRGWDENKQATFAQRTKEGSADYRYFPDPDLPSLKLSDIPEFTRAAIEAELPELPQNRRERYIGMGIKREDADMFVREPGYGALFDAVAGEWGKDDPRIGLTANIIANNVAGVISAHKERDTGQRDTEFKAETPMKPEHLSELIALISEKKITANAGKEVLMVAIETGKSPSDVAEERGLLGAGAGNDLENIVSSVISLNMNVVADYKAGKAPALQYLIGQAMKASRGAADPARIRQILEDRIAGL